LRDLDRSAVLARIERIRQSVSVLQEMLDKGEQAFGSEPHVLTVAERHAQVAAQAALDIADHIIAAAGWPMPTSYADAFRIVSREGLVPLDLGDRLVRLAGLRNILVHLYLTIDPQKLFQDASQGLQDLEQYCAAVESFLEAEESRRDA